jgi:hypothetical protein
VIALLVFPNPDGMTLVSEWYHSNLGTEFEVSPMPWVYNKYVDHDNNRDAMYASLSGQTWRGTMNGSRRFSSATADRSPARIFIRPFPADQRRRHP